MESDATTFFVNSHSSKNNKPAANNKEVPNYQNITTEQTRQAMYLITCRSVSRQPLESNNHYMSVWVFVALGIQHAMRMRPIILSSLACLALPYSSTSSHKHHDFVKSYWTSNVCFHLPYTFCLKHFSFQEKFSEILSCMYHVKYQLFLSDFDQPWILSTDLRKKKAQISNFIKIRPVGAELFYAKGPTDNNESNTRFSQFYERVTKVQRTSLVTKLTELSRLPTH